MQGARWAHIRDINGLRTFVVSPSLPPSLAEHLVGELVEARRAWWALVVRNWVSVAVAAAVGVITYAGAGKLAVAIPVGGMLAAVLIAINCAAFEDLGDTPQHKYAGDLIVAVPVTYGRRAARLLSTHPERAVCLNEALWHLGKYQDTKLWDDLCGQLGWSRR